MGSGGPNGRGFMGSERAGDCFIDNREAGCELCDVKHDRTVPNFCAYARKFGRVFGAPLRALWRFRTGAIPARLGPDFSMRLIRLSRWISVSAAAALISHALACAASAAAWPGERWPVVPPAELGLDESRLARARGYALTGAGSGCIIVKGRLVMSWGSPSALYDLKSTSKSIGLTVLGLALKDRKVSLDDPAMKLHSAFGVPPESNAETGWLDRITLRMLANQTAGFAKPGGYGLLLFEPGTKWHYSDGGPNWLAECLTLVYGRDLNDVLFERVFTPIGIAPADIRWRRHAYRPDLVNGIKRREFGSGFHANVQAMARIGHLYLRQGLWNGEQILPREFIETARRPGPDLAALPMHDRGLYGDASRHCGLLWWNNADGTIASLPRDTYWSWGLYDSLIVIAPSLDLVVARAGRSWKRAEGADHYDVLKPFLEPIAAAFSRREPAAVTTQGGSARGQVAGNRSGNTLANGDSDSPFPPSPVIQSIVWAPTNEIIRLARGSDNWPITWADDNSLYTHDSDSAYERADRMVLGRAPKHRVRERSAWEFFAKLDERGQPVWTSDIAARGAVFANPGRCYRSSVSYSAALERYLWCQTGAGEDTRFAGGFAIYDAPEPWGPWTTAFSTDQWDVGPGETQHLPARWMSADGRTIQLLFSGDDCFSVRRGWMELVPDESRSNGRR